VTVRLPLRRPDREADLGVVRARDRDDLGQPLLRAAHERLARVRLVEQRGELAASIAGSSSTKHVAKMPRVSGADTGTNRSSTLFAPPSPSVCTTLRVR
jgi:hypothetical protein